MAGVIICEKTGAWARGIRREAPDLQVIETRDVQSLWDELSASPSSVAVLELTAANRDQALALLVQANRQLPETRVIVAGGREFACYEWLVREAGAAHAVFSPRKLAPVVRLIRRRLEALAEQDLSPTDQIRARLPWGD